MRGKREGADEERGHLILIRVHLNNAPFDCFFHHSLSAFVPAFWADAPAIVAFPVIGTDVIAFTEYAVAVMPVAIEHDAPSPAVPQKTSPRETSQFPLVHLSFDRLF